MRSAGRLDCRLAPAKRRETAEMRTAKVALNAEMFKRGLPIVCIDEVGHVLMTVPSV